MSLGYDLRDDKKGIVPSDAIMSDTKEEEKGTKKSCKRGNQVLPYKAGELVDPQHPGRPR